MLPLLAALALLGGLSGCNGSGPAAPPPDTASGTVGERVRIVLDGDVSDWPIDSAAWIDDHYLYLRFTIQDEQFTLQSATKTLAVNLDLDGSAETGRTSTDEAFAGLGVDMEVQFSPQKEGGGTERGTALFAIASDGTRTPLSKLDFDFVTVPSFASSWYEARISRTPEGEPPIPAGGLLGPGTIKGVVATLDGEGRVEAYADLFELESRARCIGGRKLSSLDVPAKPGGAVRVVSFNVLRGKPVQEPETFRRILRAIEPDVILFQEWDQGDAAVVRSWLTANLSDIGNWDVSKPEGDMSQGGGVAVASRFPIETIGPAVKREGGGPVRAAVAAVQTPAGLLLATSVHLKCCGTKDSREDRQRMEEARAIAQRVGEISKKLSPAMIVIGGDLNLVGSRPPLDVIRSGIDLDASDLTIADSWVFGSNAIYTWRAEGSDFAPGRLDYVMFSDSTADAVQSFALDTNRFTDEALARLGLDRTDSAASDHLPVVVDLLPIR